MANSRVWQSKHVVVIVLALVVSATILPGVLAADFQTQGTNEINLAPDTTQFQPNQIINLANSTDPSKVQLEKDVLNPAFMVPGKFLGPYIRTSEFQFTYVSGGNFTFWSTFRFTHEQIMGGVGEFWVRWPVDVSLFSSYCVTISNYSQTSIYAYPPPYYGDFYDRCVGASFSSSFPYWQPSPVNGLGGPNTTVSDTEGLYTRYFGFLWPDRTYQFIFQGILKGGASPAVWASIEKYQVENETTFQFDNPLTGSHHTEHLALYPAFAFNFVTTIGDGGLTAYHIPFDGTPKSFIGGAYVVGVGCSNYITPCASQYISIYLPFLGATDVNWNISIPMACTDLSGVFHQRNNQFWVNHTKDFLLTSTPWNVTTMNTGLPCDSGTSNGFYIFFYANKPVTLLALAPLYSSLCCSDMPLRFHDEDGRNYNDVFSVMARGQVVPIFISADFTTGRWAVVTPGPYFATYDFGWGRAYLFPGEVHLLMFLQNGTAIGFDSVHPISGPANGTANSCRVIPATTIPVVGPVADWLNSLACFILGLVGNIIGVVQNVFNFIWNGLQALGNWLYSALMGFVDFVVKLVSGIVDIAEQIVFSLLTATPFVLIIFVSSRGIPDLTDIKRGYRRASRATSRAYNRNRIAKRGVTRYHEARTESINAKLKESEKKDGGK